MGNVAEAIQFGANFGAQIVGLLSIWRQERKSEADDHFQDFIVWLENHNFHALGERIFESDELQRELHSLLSGDLQRIEVRLDELAAQMARLIGSIDGLQDIDRAIASDQGSLSAQACEILKLFAESKGAEQMMAARLGSEGLHLRMIPHGGSFIMSDQRFIADDLESLLKADLIRLDHYTAQSHAVYTLTRKGDQVASTLPAIEAIGGS